MEAATIRIEFSFPISPASTLRSIAPPGPWLGGLPHTRASNSGCLLREQPIAPANVKRQALQTGAVRLLGKTISIGGLIDPSTPANAKARRASIPSPVYQ